MPSMALGDTFLNDPGCSAPRSRRRDPQDILAVPLESHGRVAAGTLSRLCRSWLRDRVGELDPALERLAAALPAELGF